ncbi:nickel-dependent hydrogenase large subunit [Herbaspirillum sp. ST 5-3]|uniref:nickel-dependent hydrogenase large subunit n=1 Tax=Oxalobacteraceae TaxID=75682 RepID=UPI0010A3D5E5|nr:nickel-dependent hydrogenase large subunit [Herbaspirillum sp. ST 5-3]
MSLEGKIRIKLDWDGRHVTAAALQPRKLVPIQTLLHGKRPEHALQIISMLFSLCGKAQTAAAATALQAAGDATSRVPAWRERAVAAEALQELLWRFLIDLPRLMELPTDTRALARFRQGLMAYCDADNDERASQADLAELEADVHRTLLGQVTLGDVRTMRELLQCLREANTTTASILLQCRQLETGRPANDVPLMPHAERNCVLEELMPVMTETNYSICPHWNGRAMETGSLARMQHHPLLAWLLQQEGRSLFARLLARLCEIHALFAHLRAPDDSGSAWVQGATPAEGIGLAWVQNARGLLLHHAVLDAAGNIHDYRIVAPTEWNFHPQGICTRTLTGMAAPSENALRHHVELLVQSLDPCVSHEVEVYHA